MLTRIYGITFPKQKMLDEYLVFLEEARKKNHRRIGKELELFAFSTKVGMGLPLWLPKGSEYKTESDKFLNRSITKERLQDGYNATYRQC